MLHKHLTNVHTYSLNSQTVLLHVYGNSNSCFKEFQRDEVPGLKPHSY